MLLNPSISGQEEERAKVYGRADRKSGHDRGQRCHGAPSDDE